MAHRSKRMREVLKDLDRVRLYDMQEAIDFLQKAPPVKFDQTLEVSVHLGVDPKKADQLVRGTVSLPHGTGRKIRVLVIAKGEKVEEALENGADFAGYEEYIKKIQEGWVDFDVLVVTPDMMREVGKLGKILGPRGLMPTPKAGTVTTEVGKVVREVKAGKIEYKVDKNAVVNNAVGKLSFTTKQLLENVRELLQSLIKAKPAAAKGNYIKSITLSSTMGAGYRINFRELLI